jgi:hypothetical protein
MYVNPIATMNLNLTNRLRVIAEDDCSERLSIQVESVNEHTEWNTRALGIQVAMNHILKLKLLISQLVGKLLFAAVSIALRLSFSTSAYTV